MADRSHDKPPIHLSGTVEKVIFHNPDSGFCVLLVEAQGRQQIAPVVGTLPQVRAGEWIDADGHWTLDPQHGRQFKAETLRTTAPSTLEGLERYLGSGQIEGIGPKLAATLVQKFKMDVLDVIENNPRKLVGIKGIGRRRIEKIRAAAAQQKVVRDIMLFLHSHGVSTGRAFRIYKAYGQEAIEKVRSDPYRLARDIRGIGFLTADQIAAALGVDRHSPQRAAAGVEYVLHELTQDGHCAYPREQLVARCAGLLDIPGEIIQQAVEAGAAYRRLVLETHGRTELVYLASLYRAEVELAGGLVALGQGRHPCPAIDADKAVAWVQRRVGLTLAPEQRQALLLATRAKVMVITGGPGVGKTTLVNAILRVLGAKKLDVVLCAPTGRAAKRLSETTSRQARTIHRLLAFDPKSGAFRYGPGHPLEGDVFVIDETSMVDLPLAHKIVGAIPPEASLLLVGDVDQLPSVGPGSFLRDVIESGTVPVVRLTEVFRQAAQSAIITNAHHVNNGRMPVFPPAGPKAPPADFYFVRAEDPARGVELIVRLVKERIPQRFGFDPLDDIQVITPMHKGELGAQNLNAVLQRELNPTGEQVERLGWIYRVGDKVMQIVNNYDKDVFNGDIGRVERIDPADHKLRVRFDRGLVEYSPDEMDELVLSYAITIHKSQGSEYPVVIVPLHTQHFVMLQRNLIYTAITRSRKLVVIVGTAKAISLAVSRAASRKRITTLKERLQAAAGGGQAQR